MSSIVRTESHVLATSPEARADIARTIRAYRRAVRALRSVLMTHWPELHALTNKCQAVESLFHTTARRPQVKYPVLDRMLGKMPCYLRRAAIEHAVGAVSSFQSNWENFLDGQVGGREREAGARSPRLGQANVFPSLYGWQHGALRRRLAFGAHQAAGRRWPVALQRAAGPQGPLQACGPARQRATAEPVPGAARRARSTGLSRQAESASSASEQVFWG